MQKYFEIAIHNAQAAIYYYRRGYVSLKQVGTYISDERDS